MPVDRAEPVSCVGGTATVFKVEALPSLLTCDPIGTLKPAGAATWIADGPLIRFHYLGIHLPFPQA